MKAISGKAAYNLDQSLFTKYKFSVSQLMELAGLSVAICSARSAEAGPILVCAGPGNNGGDGLVAARHLVHLGRQVHLFYPKRPNKPLYQDLFESAQLCGVSVVSDVTELSQYSQIVDAIFGFSFDPSGGIRAPFDALISALAATHVPILSVDVPSGWNVDSGPLDAIPCFHPAVNISLSAPKPCIKSFRGQNFLGGRFIPADLASEYNLRLPQYPAEEQIVKFELADVDFD